MLAVVVDDDADAVLADLQVVDPERQELRRQSRCQGDVTNPICWPEPFGLVMAEALTCGTPVLAFPNGCRTAAEERFSLARMAADHERLYLRLLATREGL